MNKSKKIWLNPYADLLHEKRLIEEHFDNFSCSIVSNILYVKGNLNLQHTSKIYKVKITHKAGGRPIAYILNQEIEPTREIHMYSNRALCLYYEPDLKWGYKTKIFSHTIPWICEWIIFYELYLDDPERGWLGKESPVHISINEIQEHKN